MHEYQIYDVLNLSILTCFLIVQPASKGMAAKILGISGLLTSHLESQHGARGRISGHGIEIGLLLKSRRRNAGRRQRMLHEDVIRKER